MVRLLVLAAALVLSLTAPALADPTALSYTFDWTITSRYAEFNFGPPFVLTSAQNATVTGHGPFVRSGGACNFQFDSSFFGTAQRASVSASEPTTPATMGLGLIVAGMLRRRRR